MVAALRSYVDGFGERTGIPITLRVDGHERRLSPEAELALFRVAQEALANIAHHAQARQMTIILLQESDRLTLTVSDDGRGFDPDAIDTGHHLGIRGMRERAEMVGATLEVDSELGRGTTIRLTVEEKP